MTTTRPYQKAMEVTYVLERLREMAHKRFDVAVIEALVRSHAKGGLIPTERRRRGAALRAPRRRDEAARAALPPRLAAALARPVAPKKPRPRPRCS